MTLLVFPGEANAGAQAWRRAWLAAFAEAEAVAPPAPGRPLPFWTEALAAALRRRPGAVVAAEGRAALAVLHGLAGAAWLPLAGAILIDPVDTERSGGRGADGFPPIPAEPLDVPALVVRHRGSAAITLGRARVLAALWEAAFLAEGPEPAPGAEERRFVASLGGALGRRPGLHLRVAV